MKRSASHLRLAAQLGADPKWSWKVGMPVQLGDHEHLVTAIAKPLAGVYRVGLFLSGLEVDGDGDPLCRLTCDLGDDGVAKGEWARVDRDGAAYNGWPPGQGPLPAWWHPAMLGFLRQRIRRAAGDGYAARDAMVRGMRERDEGWYTAETHARVLLDLWKRGTVIYAEFE